jgi:two-component sensor histidine kinase
VASIDMQAYVLDLVNYLRDCLDTSGRRIRIEQLIEPIRIDLAQAVPIGLILNEAITNAIKYAFDEKGGEIIIALQMIGQEHLLMTIADNGKGLPVDFDIQTASSLGMEMMKALSKQLGGEFKITNKSGTNITVEFQLDRVLAAGQRATL